MPALQSLYQHPPPPDPCLASVHLGPRAAMLAQLEADRKLVAEAKLKNPSLLQEKLRAMRNME